MTRPTLPSLVIMMLLTGAACAGERPFDATAAFMPPAVKLGEEAVLTVRVTPMPDAPPLRVRVRAPVSESEALRIEELDPANDALLDRPDAGAEARFRVRTFSPRATALPGCRIEYAPPGGDWASTIMPLPELTLVPVLQQGDAGASMPPLAEWNEPLAMEAPFPLIPVAIGAALLALVAFVIWRVRRRGEVYASAPPPVPPHATALRALDALEAEGLLERGEAETFFIRLTDILRVYLEGRFALRAPELTTEEFCRQCAMADALDQGQKDMLRAAMEKADLIKFARARAAAEDGRATLDAARGFVRRSIPAPAEGVA